MDANSPYLDTKDQLIAKINRADCDYYTIRYDGNICGGVAVYKKSLKINRLAIIFVSPACQNKKIAQRAIHCIHQKYPNAKKWELDFPIDRMTNKKCYEKSGYSDTGNRKTINNKLTLAFYQRTC